jgi:hypothetical protein
MKTQSKIKSVEPRRHSPSDGRFVCMVAGAISTALLLSPLLVSQNAPETPKPVAARGTLQRAAGIGGETTGWILQLDFPVHVQGKELNDIEVEGKLGQPDKLENKYIEAIGALEFKTGVERGSRSVLNARILRQVSVDGRAELEAGYVRMTLAMSPTQIVWKKLMGHAKPVYPSMALSAVSGVQTVLKFGTAAQICYAVRNVETHELTWKYPGQPNAQPSEYTFKSGQPFVRLADMPESAAPTPGTYALQVSFCGYDEYSLTTRFVVRPD